MQTTLAIDQSTSSSKAILFDANGRLVDRVSRDHRQIYPQPGWVEHDAEEIWQNVLGSVQELAARNQSAMSSLENLAITNQRETVVVFDRLTGRPLYHAIVWQCRRGDPICDELRRGGKEDMIRRKTGLQLDSYFSGSKLRWLVDHVPDLESQLVQGKALIGTIDAYLIYRLTEGRVFATDPTNASRTLLYHIGSLQWDDELCGLFRVPREALPEVRESAAEFGTTDVHGGLPKRVPIQGVMGDSQASLFGQGCFQPGMAKATFGTGTSVLLNVGHQLPAMNGNAVTALAWVWHGQPTYALEGIINYSSATVTWLKDQAQMIGDAAETEVLARSVEDNGGVYFVPAFAGLSAPYWSPHARAAIVGMTGYTGRAHIVRAALEAISYQIRDVLEMLGSESGISPRHLFADGGPTHNEFLMQFTADVTRIDLLVADVAESSAWGAARAGQLGRAGADPLNHLDSASRAMRRFLPQMEPASAERFYQGWQRAVSRVTGEVGKH